jgi:hypothetical protein
MEQIVTHEIERKKDGTKIVRNFFFNKDKTNYMILANSYFAKDQKKQAKLNYKHNSIERENLVRHLVKQPFPNWNLKVSFL